MSDPLEGVVWYVVFLLSTTFHEAAHAWAAKRGGDLTAYLGGQVSLDPRPHIRREPLGMVVLPVISIALSGWPFGFASTPYDPRWAQEHPRRAAWMSLAGPASNLALVLVTGALVRLGIAAGVLVTPEAVGLASIATAAAPGVGSTLALVLSVFFSLNLILATLNLIPLPPLDGSGALPLLLPEGLAERWRGFVAQPALAWLGLLVAWNLFDDVFRPVFLIAVSTLHGVGFG
jgi:Zn-dependent protease